MARVDTTPSVDAIDNLSFQGRDVRFILAAAELRLIDGEGE